MTNIDQKMESMQKQMESMQKQMESLQKQMESMRLATRFRMESISGENRVKMESILIASRVGMHSVRYEYSNECQSIIGEIAQLKSTIERDQPIQLQSEEGSGVVDAAPGVRNGEQHVMQLTEGSEMLENEEYINTDSQYYGYFYGLPGLFRVKIPLSRNQDIKIEPVILNDDSYPLPHGLALFSHPLSHNIYIVGGQSVLKCAYSHSVYVFDPNRFDNLPINSIGRLGKPEYLQHSFKPMIHPSLVQYEDRIYLISACNDSPHNATPFNFQSFDLTKKHFETLTGPPFQKGRWTVVGFFSLCGYIYLLLKKVFCEDEDPYEDLCEGHIFAYIYNTRLSQWEEQSLDRFEQVDIPLPSSRIGDVGLSDPFCDKFRILVILNNEGPAAYCIQLCDNGSLRPNSYRRLNEIFIHENYRTAGDFSYLHDMGQGRFRVIYRSDKVPLLIYAFKIDFEVEHQIQVYGINKSNPSSSHVLYSKKCEDPIPLWDMDFIHTLCLASATSNKGRGGVAAKSSVGKDLEEKDKSKSSRLERRRKKSSTNHLLNQ